MFSYLLISFNFQLILNQNKNNKKIQPVNLKSTKTFFNTCTCQCLSIWVTENLNVKWGAMLVGEINWLYVVHVFVCLCSFFLHENGISSTDRSNFTTRRFVVVTNTKKILQFCPNTYSQLISPTNIAPHLTFRFSVTHIDKHWQVHVLTIWTGYLITKQ
jgi:hypothetical protein